MSSAGTRMFHPPELDWSSSLEHEVPGHSHWHVQPRRTPHLSSQALGQHWDIFFHFLPLARHTLVFEDMLSIIPAPPDKVVNMGDE